jgi:1-acyl-sn-glycerol-3-phosphate acyltransferase
MATEPNLALQLWLTIWRGMQRYHAYSVEGLEHLDGKESALVVGYHGRPWAWDMCMLMAAVHDRLGYYPHGIVHNAVDRVPALRWVVDALGCTTGDDETLMRAKRLGEHVFTTPGGAREGMRTVRSNYRVDWGYHTGYIATALKHGMCIVPVAAAGADGAYIGLTDPYAIADHYGLPQLRYRIPWLGIGPLGFFPFSPPFPVRMHQLVGEPIDPVAEGGRQDSRESLLQVHRRVTDAVQALLDRARQTPKSARGDT